jgi:hypothetical protein
MHYIIKGIVLVEMRDFSWLQPSGRTDVCAFGSGIWNLASVSRQGVLRRISVALSAGRCSGLARVREGKDQTRGCPR